MARLQDIGERCIRHILDGRSEEMRTLIRLYEADIVAFVGRMLPRAEDVEEAVQDTFVAAYQSLASYDRSKASVATWLRRIAFHTTTHQLRRRRTNVVYLEDNETLLAGISDAEADRLWEEAPESEAARIDEALMRLKEEDRMLVHLFYYEGKSLAEIGYILDCKVGALATRLCRIRKKLYIILKEKGI